MNRLQPLTIDTAPQGSKETLQNIQKGFGFIPNLMATFANSPAVLNGYMGLDAAWSSSSLTPKEQQIILLTTSVENNCRYCTAAHSTILKGMMKVDASVVQAIRSKSALEDRKLQALVSFTREAVGERGFVSENTKENFRTAGYSDITMMEVLVGVALKTVSNYLDHLNPTPIDSAFASEA
jgi:uncharacterized peroxidase-related enzyme